ncbi:MAG: ester cyclase [Acidimicrobiales bacterium]
MSDTTADCTALVRRLFDEVFNGRDIAALDELVAVDYTEHALAPFESEEPGAVDGPAHMRGVVAWLVDQYPDLHMDVAAAVSDGDLIAVRVISEGTNTGKLNGFMPPTGRRFRAEQSHWYRVQAGKLVEHWAVRDDLRTMQQLGLVPGPEPVR